MERLHEKPRCHIVLIGLMGCGKSTVGKALGKLTGLPLLDTDAVIEEQVGMSIPEIFRKYGEKRFRSLETALLRYLLEHQAPESCIIATGGGIVVRPANRPLLRRLGFTVWLHAEVPVLLQRTAHTANRPLLQDTDRERRINELSSQRAPFYAETAHWTLEVGHSEVFEIAQRILERAADFSDHGKNAFCGGV